MCANIARKQFGHEHGRSRITIPSRPAHGGATVRPQDVSTPKRILIFDHPLRAPPACPRESPWRGRQMRKCEDECKDRCGWSARHSDER